jgi:hypothetical protein
MVGTCRTYETGNINEYKNLNGKPQRMRKLTGYRRKWENNIKMNVKEICKEGVNSTRLARGMGYCWKDIYTAMNLRISEKAWNIFNFRSVCYFLKNTLLHRAI